MSDKKYKQLAEETAAQQFRNDISSIKDKLDTIIQLLKPAECNCQEEEVLDRKYARAAHYDR